MSSITNNQEAEQSPLSKSAGPSRRTMVLYSTSVETSSDTGDLPPSKEGHLEDASASGTDQPKADLATTLARPDPEIYDMDLNRHVAFDVRALVSMYAGPVATVVVGPEKTEYAISMTLLFHFSALAERTLNSTFKEGAGNTFALPEINPKVFGLLLVYMTQGRILVHDYSRRPQQRFFEPVYESLVKSCLLLCQLYVLVDYLECPYSQTINFGILDQLKYVIDEATELDQPTPITPSTLLYVSRNTPDKSLLRDFVIDDLRNEIARMDHRPLKEYSEYIDENPEVFREEVVEDVIAGFHWGKYPTGRVYPSGDRYL